MTHVRHCVLCSKPSAPILANYSRASSELHYTEYYRRDRDRSDRAPACKCTGTWHACMHGLSRRSSSSDQLLIRQRVSIIVTAGVLLQSIRFAAITTTPTCVWVGAALSKTSRATIIAADHAPGPRPGAGRCVRAWREGQGRFGPHTDDGELG